MKRVHEITRELRAHGIELDNKELVSELVALGYDVKSASSPLEDDQANAAIQKIVNKRKPKAAVPQVAPKGFVVRRKVGDGLAGVQEQVVHMQAPAERPYAASGRQAEDDEDWTSLVPEDPDIKAKAVPTTHSVGSYGRAVVLPPPQRDPKKVFLIHGRNMEARKQIGYFLAALGLEALNFDDVRVTLKGTPTIVDIVRAGMDQAQGVIALFTADEYAWTRPEFMSGESGESVERWQARPNVLFEAGMAFGRDRDRVVFVKLGRDGIAVLKRILTAHF